MDNVFPGDAEEAQSVKDGDLEASDRREGRVDVQGVTIAREPVERGLLFRCLLIDDGVGSALGRFVHCGCGAAIAALCGAAEAAGSADEDGALVVEDVLAGVGVLGGCARDDDAGCAFVDDFDEAWVRDELGFGGDGVFADFEVLLTMEEHHGREVGEDISEGEGRCGVKGGYHAKSREDVEVVVVLKDEGKIGPFGTKTKICPPSVSPCVTKE